MDGRNESGIEGILTRLEKERNLSLGISLRENGKSNVAVNDISPNGSVPWSSRIVVCFLSGNFALHCTQIVQMNKLFMLPTFFIKDS